MHFLNCSLIIDIKYVISNACFRDAADIVEIFVGNAPPPIILVGHR